METPFGITLRSVPTAIGCSNEHIARALFAEVPALVDKQNRVAGEHSTVDGTLIEAWVSLNSFIRKDGDNAPSGDDGRTTRHAGYRARLKIRKRVEEIFGWSKTVVSLRKTHFIGLGKVKPQTVFIFAAYNLTRMASLGDWHLTGA